MPSYKARKAERAQYLFNRGISISEIARRLRLNWNTVCRYVEGESEEVCRYYHTLDSKSQDNINEYKDLILDDIALGVNFSITYRRAQEKGYKGGYKSFINQCRMLCAESGNALPRKRIPQSQEHQPDIITRTGMFKHLWERKAITQGNLNYIYEQFNTVGVLDRCIREFRDIFKNMSVPRLQCFIDKYSICGIKSIENFAKGLAKDYDAVENAVSTSLSNGFVEGTNSKAKMIKRTMYGRCSLRLLTAKIMLSGYR